MTLKKLIFLLNKTPCCSTLTSTLTYMKKITSFCTTYKVMIFVAFATVVTLWSIMYPNNYEQPDFSTFKVKYNRTYELDDSVVKNVFDTNMKMALFYQHVNPYARFGINEYADMESYEFAKRLSLLRDTNSPTLNEINVINDTPLYPPSFINWSIIGAVTPVKNQNNDPNGFAFATVGMIENQWFLSGNNLTSFSENELILFNLLNVNNNVGTPIKSLQWLIDFKNGFVNGSDLNSPQICGYHRIYRDENMMAKWILKKGAIIVSVDASIWKSYNGGVITNCLSNRYDSFVNHHALLVGFDDFHDPPYWIVKNSWGESWGESGYIKIAKGSNQCLINTIPTAIVLC